MDEDTRDNLVELYEQKSMRHNVQKTGNSYPDQKPLGRPDQMLSSKERIISQISLAVANKAMQTKSDAELQRLKKPQLAGDHLDYFGRAMGMVKDTAVSANSCAPNFSMKRALSKRSGRYGSLAALRGLDLKDIVHKQMAAQQIIGETVESLKSCNGKMAPEAGNLQLSSKNPISLDIDLLVSYKVIMPLMRKMERIHLEHSRDKVKMVRETQQALNQIKEICKDS